MNAEQLTSSINTLIHSCQGIRVPLVPCGKSADDVTFLGIVFPFNGTPPTAKIYFSPRGGRPSLPSEMPEALRKSMERTIQSYGGEHLRLHDASVECTKDGEIVGRMLWALRSGDRVDDMRWPGIVRKILAGLGHSRLAAPLLRLDGCLRNILGSELAPLCQLGGFLAPDGSLFRIKANFDADLNRSAEHVEYNRDRSRVATQFLLGECGLMDADVARLLSRLDAAMQGECHFHSWGFHAENARLENIKVYVKDKRPTELAFPAIFKAFSLDMAGTIPESCLRPDVFLLPFGWRYWGFYIEVTATSIRTLKFYFQVPESQKSSNGAPVA